MRKRIVKTVLAQAFKWLEYSAMAYTENVLSQIFTINTKFIMEYRRNIFIYPCILPDPYLI